MPRSPEFNAVADVSKAIQANLGDVATKLLHVIETDSWRRFALPVPSGREVVHETFESFVTADRPDGLGTDMETIRGCCQNRPHVMNAVDKLLQRPVGRPKGTASNRTNSKTGGTTKEQALRRLRDSRPDLLDRVLSGELTPHAAAIEAGFRKRTITVPLDPEAAARSITKHFSADELVQLVRLLKKGKP